MYCKVHETPNGRVIGCCDSELLGKSLTHGNYDVTISESFYKGELVDEKKLADLMLGANSINLFGKKTSKVAIEQGFLREADIIRIAGVEHAMIFKV